MKSDKSLKQEGKSNKRYYITPIKPTKSSIFIQKDFYTFFTIYKKLSRLSVKGRDTKFNKLCIYSIKGNAKHILNMTEYISNGKNLKIKPIDSNFNNKKIAYCPDSTFGIILLIALSKLKQRILFFLM